MVAIWTIERDTLNLYRKTDQFPVALLDPAITILQNDVSRADK